MIQDLIFECLSFFPVPLSAKGLLGFASLRLNGCLILNCIAVYTRPQGGIRLLFPLGSLPNGLQVSAYHPIDKNVTEKMTDAISAKIQNLNQKVPKEPVCLPQNFSHQVLA